MAGVTADAFADCTNLTLLKIVVDGVSMISSSDGTILVSYPADKTDEQYTLPAEVNYIDDNAFAGNTHLKSLYVMQDTPPSLGDNVFPQG